jgi:two-component system osmolarity sensor histidine kinase EnvZ
MKLQLTFIKDKDLSKKMSQDINEMERMLNEYLQFTSSNYLEKNETFDISELIKTIIKKYENKNISNELNFRTYMTGRKNLIKRSLNNLIDNSIKYANKIHVQLLKKNNSIIIIIDDDGPGIPKEEHVNVFKPFYKISKGRSDSRSSVGLGLSITSDIIKSHGGNILLEKSSLNGLRVKIFFPL